MLGARITSIAGASSYFKGGVIVYSNQAKTDLLSVPKDLIEEYGAVSAKVAKSMAEGVLRRFDSDFSISITGIPGPDGGTNEKPVGTVCIGIASRRFAEGERYNLQGSRQVIRELAVVYALDMLRLAILGDQVFG